ncbi:SWIM zinc finger family protein [Zavarzinella formosa]|uniref:SWIM zinc finger family protein n=1 Tax=Zavarzinella formosa TaxID=360055 RepID=UPI0003146100|nr:SWIM zinc finger family protein [Zavarzinella formosa]
MADLPIRTIALIRPADDRGVFVFRIVAERRTAFYVAKEIPCQIGGRGFAVHKLGFGDLMHVRVGRGADQSCECLGFLRYGRCRHILGLAALIRKHRM